MNKHLGLFVDIKFPDDPKQPVLSVLVKREGVRDFCLGLSLLQEALVDALIVTGVDSRKSLKLRRRMRHDDDPRAQMTFKHEAAVIDVPATALKYLLYFFLRYYRDGAAEVDHVDLETTGPELDRASGYLTIKVDDFAAPVSAEEAARRLSL